MIRAVPALGRGETFVSRIFNYFTPRSEEVVVDLPGGARMILDLSDYVCFYVYMCGCYERHVVKALTEVLREAATFFDVGAHFGQYSLMAAAIAGPEGSVHAFEPGPRQFEYLGRNRDLNGFSHLVANRMALGSREGATGFVVGPSRNLGASHLADGAREGLSVPMTTVDAYCRERGIERLDVMKVDVEGAERDVFLGASETLRSLRPTAVFYECFDKLCRRYGHTAEETHGTLVSSGYSIHRVTAEGLTPYSGPPSEEEADFVALRDPL